MSQLTTNSAGQYRPAVSDDIIAWDDDRNGNLDIYMYELSKTPAELTQALIEKVQSMVNGDTLTEGQGIGLMDKLNQIVSKIENSNLRPAINQLKAFENQVSGLMRANAITIEEGNELIEAADSIIEKLQNE